MQMVCRSFPPPFFFSARMSFLFHPGLDMCANSALALKGGEVEEAGGWLLGLPLVMAEMTGALTLARTLRMTLHPAEQPE